MNHFKTVFIIAFVIVLLVLTAKISERGKKLPRAKPAVTPDANDITAVIAGNNAFALDMYTEIKDAKDIQQDNSNIFFSPYSISAALAMTYAGARGRTEKQMAKTLYLSLPKEQLHPAFRVLEKKLKADSKEHGYQLSIANALWGQEGYSYLPSFLAIAKNNYGATLKEVDFIKETEKTRKIINIWVEEKTENKIAELIKPRVLSALTRLVLTNAIYFKGDWASKFEEENTQEQDFTTWSSSDNVHKTPKKVKVDMMFQKGSFKYAEDEHLQILELPYKGEYLSMIIFLPEAGYENLEALEKDLTQKNMKDWLESLHKQQVILYVPKFKITSQFRLADYLKAMGIPDAFSLPPADFSGMSGKKDLFLSAVTHKAYVEVNEEGTEAAAATAVMPALTSARVHPPIFRADHPFLFIIKDVSSGSIIFMGRVSNPAKQVN